MKEPMTERHGFRRGHDHFKRYHMLKQMSACCETVNPVTKPLPLQTKTFACEARRFVARLQCALILGQCVDGINRSQQHPLIRLLSRHYGVAGSPCWTYSGAGVMSVCSGSQTVCVVAVRCIVARAHKVMCPCFLFFFVAYRQWSVGSCTTDSSQVLKCSLLTVIHVRWEVS